MAIINSIGSWLIKKRIHQVELFLKYPHDVQQEWFNRLINAARHTEWGINFDYASINTVQKFKERVPIQDYESLKPFIVRLRQGEQNVLWPTEIKWFAKSSGTTNDKSKFIPVSLEALEECHFKGGKDMLSFYCNNNPEANIFSGKGLVMGGSNDINQFNNESYYGDLSSIIIQNLPFWALFKKTPYLSIALMHEWEEKIERMAKTTINKNVTSISGVPSWTLLLIKRILEITGESDISGVWPNLELFMHGGVSFDPYREQFKNLIRNPGMNYLETYNASEGFFGIQDRSDESDMLLMLDYGIYYEFMPMDQLDSDNPETLGLDEVETGTNYAMVITTNAGLWRYMIGDTICFTSLDPYRIKITGRTKHFINAFGEELMIDNAEKALAKACQMTGAEITDYTAAPIYMGSNAKGAHEWLIEFNTMPRSLEEFTILMDNELKSLNSDYEAKRSGDLIIGFPLVCCAEPGTFFNWLKSKGKLGGQNKIPRLSNNRNYIEQIQNPELSYQSA